MSGGWFVFSVVTCIIVCTGCLLTVAVLKASWAQRERESLTSSDLRALEESALYLIDQLKSEAEQAMSDLESRRVALAAMMAESEKQAAAFKQLLTSAERLPVVSPESRSIVEKAYEQTDPRSSRVLELASTGMDHSEIARNVGIDCAEVKLMLRLAEAKG